METSTGNIKFDDSFCDDGSINVLEFIQSDASFVGETLPETAKKKTPVKKKAKGVKQTPTKRKRKPKPGTKYYISIMTFTSNLCIVLLMLPIMPYFS